MAGRHHSKVNVPSSLHANMIFGKETRLKREAAHTPFPREVLQRQTEERRVRTYQHREVPMIPPSARALILATVFATFAGVPNAQAGSQFDGTWALNAVTRTGECDRNFRLNGKIANGIVYYQGGGTAVSGSANPRGQVNATLRIGPNHAMGSGRLSSASGTGTWRGQGPSGVCSGTWSAQRM